MSGKLIIKVIAFIFGGYLIFSLVGTMIYTKINIKRVGQEVETVAVKTLEDVKQLPEVGELATVTSRLDYALPLRTQLIDEAEESLLISQYTIADDDSGLIFLGKLLEAAKRGVKVKLIVNGLSNRYKSFSRAQAASLPPHPNFELKIIGGFNLLRPWETNDVLHDKLIIVDDKYFLSSGRNIEKRFMLEDEDVTPTYDLDILVKGPAKASQFGLIQQGTDYFMKLWQNPRAKKRLHNRQYAPRFFRKRIQKNFIARIEQALADNQGLIAEDIISKLTFNEVEGGYLVHNSVGTIVKQPLVWKQTLSLLNEGKDEVIVQSPYVVVTDEMTQVIPEIDTSAELHVLTNSAATSPNLLAFAGYLNQKTDLLELGNFWEYQGKGSLHQKAFAIDGELGMVGSLNVDSRSAYLSSENLVIIHSQAFTQQLTDIMEDYQGESLQATADFSYKVPTDSQAPNKLGGVKKNILRVLSWLVQPFMFML